MCHFLRPNLCKTHAVWVLFLINFVVLRGSLSLFCRVFRNFGRVFSVFWSGSGICFSFYRVFCTYFVFMLNLCVFLINFVFLRGILSQFFRVFREILCVFVGFCLVFLYFLYVFSGVKWSFSFCFSLCVRILWPHQLKCHSIPMALIWSWPQLWYLLMVCLWYLMVCLWYLMMCFIWFVMFLVICFFDVMCFRSWRNEMCSGPPIGICFKKKF